MNPACSAFLRALREPEAMQGFSAQTWDGVVRQARTAGLLGRLASLAAPFSSELPPAIRHHLETASGMAGQQRRAVQWELVKLDQCLAELGIPAVLLKGAAYVAGDLAPAAGRMFSDVDILVAKRLLEDTETALRRHGWATAPHDDYDLRYYREWMHELPPMQHLHRATWLDVHHNLLPETARRKTRPDLILAASRPLPGYLSLAIPAPVDLILHSASHLFLEGEWQHGLRDLADMDALLRDYGRDPAFWPALLARAEALNLGLPLYYALRYARRLLHTPVPERVEQDCPERPHPAAAVMLDALFLPAIATAHSDCRTWFSGPAAFALYVRGHALKMPFHLLIPHLLHKAFKPEE